MTVAVSVVASAPLHTFGAILSATTKNNTPDTIVPHNEVSHQEEPHAWHNSSSQQVPSSKNKTLGTTAQHNE